MKEEEGLGIKKPKREQRAIMRGRGKRGRREERGRVRRGGGVRMKRGKTKRQGTKERGGEDMERGRMGRGQRK